MDGCTNAQTDQLWYENNIPFLSKEKVGILNQQTKKSALARKELTLKVPITTVADDKLCDIFPIFPQK